MFPFQALWLQRRFLALYYLKHICTNPDIIIFIDNELHLINPCIQKVNNCFEDAKAQVTHAATYALWISKVVYRNFLNVKHSFPIKFYFVSVMKLFSVYFSEYCRIPCIRAAKARLEITDECSLPETHQLSKYVMACSEPT